MSTIISPEAPYSPMSDFGRSFMWDEPDEDGEKRIVLEQLDEMGVPEDIKGYYDSLPFNIDYFMRSFGATHHIESFLPSEGGINTAVGEAMRQKLIDLMRYVGKRSLESDCPDGEAENLLRAQRDLMFALGSIDQALSLYSEVQYVGGTLTYAWYTSGSKGRHGGYEAVYTTCNDEIYHDSEDHHEQVDTLLDSGEDWPDEFHFPSRLDIKVNPLRRVEFIYTPELGAGKQRHASHSEVTDGDGAKQYSNEALSIRIDLDPDAPNGIALDIGRSAHNGRELVRSADLLGRIFTEASPFGSHEHTGFGPGMAEQFKPFAEHIAMQLNLQHMNREVATEERKTEDEKRLSRHLGAWALRQDLAANGYVFKDRRDIQDGYWTFKA